MNRFIIFLFGFSFLIAVLSLSPFFRIQEIPVEGNRVVGTEQILSLSGLRTGRSLLKLNRKGVQMRLKSHPWIKDAEVRWGFPNHLKILIVERNPMALLYRKQESYLLSEDGWVLAKGESQGYRGLIEMVDLRGEGNTPVVGKALDIPFASLLLDVLRTLWWQMPSAGLGVKKVEMDENNSLTVRFQGELPLLYISSLRYAHPGLEEFLYLFQTHPAEILQGERVEVISSTTLVVKPKSGVPVEAGNPSPAES